MFRFEHPYYLYLLLVIPALWLIQVVYRFWQRKQLKAAFDDELIQEMAPLRTGAKAWLKLSFLSLGLACLILAIANPQFGSKMEEVKRKGIDIMVALDISNSMMAEDLYPNRLERAKRSIQELFAKLKGDRIGIVVFAGEAFVQLPITTDYSAAKLFLNSIDTRLITTQGTDIGNAIQLCMESFEEESPTSKAIIIISDGENHEEAATAAAEEAAERNVVIHTIGMGSVDGAPIPVYSRGQRIGFRQAQDGSTVVTKLDEAMLKELAAETGGIFVRSSNSQSGIDYVFDAIEDMEKVEYGSKVYTDYEDRFQYLLLPALIFLVLELIIPNTKSLWWEKLFAS